MPSEFMTVRPDQTGPLFLQIAERVREGVASGLLKPGERLPSARALAAQLGSARGTVEAAYSLLQGEGYVIARGPAGTWIAPHAASTDPSIVGKLRGKKNADVEATALRNSAPQPVLAFCMGTPALDLFPRKLWARLLARRARMLTSDDMRYPGPMGYSELRTALASYLLVARGVKCQPEQIMITNGYQGALDLISRVTLSPGDDVWFEEPGHYRARRVFEYAKAKVVPIPVDADGLQVSVGRWKAPEARLAIVTPGHQHPLGMALSAARGKELLKWASSSGAWIVEDDYDGEFHYAGRRLPALKSVDRFDRVIYASSFSKTLGPALRLGYIVLPYDLIDRFNAAGLALNLGHPIFEQRVVADFIAEGHFGRHLKHMRAVYSSRRATLSEALRTVFGNTMGLEFGPGGLHVIARLNAAVDDRALVTTLRNAGFAVDALSDYYAEDFHGSGLILNMATVPEADAFAASRQLYELIKPELIDLDDIVEVRKIYQ